MDLTELEQQLEAARHNETRAASAEDRTAYGELAGYFARRMKQEKREVVLRARDQRRSGAPPAASND